MKIDPSTHINGPGLPFTRPKVDDIQSYLATRKFVKGSGPSVSPLMIVGEAPGEQEDYKGEAFVGPSGMMLDEMLKKGGSSLQQCYKNNSYQRRPPDNKIKLIPKEELAKGRDYLWQTIRAIKPNCILALGAYALEATTGKKGITEYRGSILPSLDGTPKVVATIHPANLLRQRGEGGVGYEARAYVQLDINRAIQESKSRDISLPQRLLEVAHSATDVYRFINAYKDRSRIAADIEVKHCLPICVSIAFDPWHALSIPLFNLRDHTFLPLQDYPLIYEQLYHLFQRCEVIGQNWKFDQGKLDLIGLFTPKFYADTMLMAHVLHPELPKRLQFLTSIYTREPYYKSELKEFNFKTSDYNDLFLYNAKDSAVTFECYNAMIKDMVDRKVDTFYFNFQHKLHWLYKDMEQTGLPFDREIQRELWDKYTIMAQRLQNELDILAGYPINVQSPKQVAKLLYEEIGFPPRGGTDEETLVSLYGNHAKDELKRRVIDIIIELRGILKAMGTYVAIEPDFDERIRFSYQIV